MKSSDQTVLLVLAAAFLLARSGWSFGGQTPHNPNATTGRQRPAAKTPLASSVFRQVLHSVFVADVGREPTPHELAMLLAHSAAETRRWKSMYNFNPGFVTTDGGVDWFDGQEIDPGNTLRFRAYADAESGVRDWLYVLQRDFPRAWAALDGDPVQYVDGLYHGVHGSYFGGSEVYASYQKLLNALFNEFSNWTAAEPDTSRRALPGAARGQGPLPFQVRVAKRPKRR